MINLIPISDINVRIDILYQLLEERTPEQSISHERMPTLEEHTKFVENNPYLAWYFIHDKDEGEIVGSVYLTHNREIGIAVFQHHRRKGHAKEAIRLLMKRHPGKFLANINPKNTASIELFKTFGAKHIQNTYSL